MRIIVNNISCQCVIGGMDTAKLDVYKALREYLRVRPANYSQMLFQMRKRGIKGWDGYTYFINKNCQFPTGFLPMVLNHMKELDVYVMVEDRRGNMPKFKVTLDFETPEFTLAEHQQLLITKSHNYLTSYEKAHKWIVYFPRGIWKAATNSGKTAAAGNLIKNIDGARAIMLVNNRDLLMQHYNYYKTVLKDKGELGYITSSKQKMGSVLTIAMVRTVYNRLKQSVTVQRDLHDKFNMLIVDEVHDYTSKESVYVINHINAPIRIGMSGTPFDMSDKVAKFRLIGMFGAVLHEVSKRYLMDAGYSLVPKIIMYLNPSISRADNYEQEFAEVITMSDDRAELIADIIWEHRKKKLMITFFDIAHGQLMYQTFIERYPRLAHRADIVHGTDKQREHKIQAYKDNEITILFASTIMQQGFNITDIEGVIYGMGGKEKIAPSQFMGRGERVDGINNSFLFIDIFDQGHYCSKHSRKRIAMYKKENLPEPIKFMYSNRNGSPITPKVTL